MKEFIKYDYARLTYDLIKLKSHHHGVKLASIGKSVMGRELYLIKVGHGKRRIFVNGAHHALEWLTSPVIIKLIYDILKTKKVLEENTLYFVPMVNPDGVELVLNSIKKKHPYYQLLVKMNGGADFSKNWQSNIRGVDLNHNYPAGFLMSKEMEKTHGITGPGPTRYSGEVALSEPETKALYDLTEKSNFDIVIALHSQGREIYYQYLDNVPKGAVELGHAMADASGYQLMKAEGMASYAGYKDYFIDRFSKIGYTIELGKGKNPLEASQFHSVYFECKNIFVAMFDFLQ